MIVFAPRPEAIAAVVRQASRSDLPTQPAAPAAADVVDAKPDVVSEVPRFERPEPFALAAALRAAVRPPVAVTDAQDAEPAAAAVARPPAPTARAATDAPNAVRMVAVADGPSTSTTVGTTVTATPTTDAARPAAPAAPQWVVAAESGESVPPAYDPDVIVLPGVAVEPPTVAAVVATARDVVVTAAAPLLPLVGALPVDLSAVERAAGELLGGLTETTEPTGTGRWGWAVLATLAAGGLMQALRPTDRRRPAAVVGNDSALARWESRHDRRPA